MAKYLLRVVKQVVVLELTGREKVIDATTQQQVHLKAREFMAEEFPEAAPEIEIEIKKLTEDVQAAIPPEFQPRNQKKADPF